MENKNIGKIAWGITGLLAASAFAQPQATSTGANAFVLIPWTLRPDGLVSVCERGHELTGNDRCEGVGLGGKISYAPKRVEVQEALEIYLDRNFPGKVKPIVVGVGPAPNAQTEFTAHGASGFIVYYKIKPGDR